MKMDRPDGLDDASRWILARLRADGRASLSDLARGLKMSVTAVRHRVTWLERSGIIRGYRAVVDAARTGRGLRARIRLKLAPAAAREAAGRLAKHPDVEAVRLVTGPCPLEIEAAVPDRKALNAFVRRALGGIKADRYEVEIVLESFKG